MKNSLLIFIILLIVFSTISFGGEVLAPGKGQAIIYEPYEWVFGPLGDYCWNAVGLVEGQNYNVLTKRQLNNPGTNPSCTVSWIKEQLQSHGFGVVWWAAHSNQTRISAEPYEKTPAGWNAAANAYNNYLAQGYAGLIALGENTHAYSISILDAGLVAWFKNQSTLDSALIYAWGCNTADLNDDCGAGVFVGYDITVYISSPWGADVFWERMNGEHGVAYRHAGVATEGLANGHLKYIPNNPPYLDITLAPYVKQISFGTGEMSGSVWFDIRMNTTQYNPEDIIGVTGATIVNAYWSYYDRKLNFEIGNVTQNTQHYTVHYDKAIAKALCTTILLDGNQNPQGTNGHGPNCDDYKFDGHAQTGVAEAENANEIGYITQLRTLSPNPALGIIVIYYQIANLCRSKIIIFDCAGRVVEQVEKMDNPGPHTFIWDGMDARGKHVENGCYFIKFEAGDYSAIEKCVLVK